MLKSGHSTDFELSAEPEATDPTVQIPNTFHGLGQFVCTLGVIGKGELFLARLLINCQAGGVPCRGKTSMMLKVCFDLAVLLCEIAANKGFDTGEPEATLSKC